MVVRPGKNLFREKLEKNILMGLGLEWETALWVLKQDHQEKMRKPLFSLHDLKTRLGSWCPQKREISLSRGLTFNHSWDAVREVLLHEMAHQLADEVLGADDEPPHGKTFHKACHLLRANPKASGSRIPLDDLIFRDPCRKEDGLVARIRKLMALGKSENHNEAEAAMAKAHELIAKYNVSLDPQQARTGYVSIFVDKPRLRHQREEYSLANLLQDFYFVSGIWVSAYVLDKKKMGRVLEISGTLQNIQTASYVHDFVHRYIQTQWCRYAEDRKLSRHRKTDFAIGIIEGFRSSLSSKQKRDDKKGIERGLIRLGDRMLAEYTAYKYPRVVQFKRAASRHNVQVYEDGIALGKQLTVAKGISQKNKGGTALMAP